MIAGVNDQGEIIEGRRYYDVATMLRQLGLMPRGGNGAGRRDAVAGYEPKAAFVRESSPALLLLVDADTTVGAAGDRGVRT